MPFDAEKRTLALEALRRRRVLEDVELTATERLLQAEELLALSWTLHGPPKVEPWALLAARRAARRP